MLIKDLFNFTQDKFEIGKIIISYNLENFFKIKEYYDSLIIKDFISNYYFTINDNSLYYKSIQQMENIKIDNIQIKFVLRIKNTDFQIPVNLSNNLTDIFSIFDLIATENYKKPFKDTMGFIVNYAFVVLDKTETKFISNEWIASDDVIYFKHNNEIVKLYYDNYTIVKINETEYAMLKLKN